MKQTENPDARNMRMTYDLEEVQESERYKKMLIESGELGRMLASGIEEQDAIIESLEPPNSSGRYNHIRVRVVKGRQKNSLWGGREYRIWLQARHGDDFSEKYILPKNDSLEAIVKHCLTPEDFIIVRQPLGEGKVFEKSVGTMTEAFDELFNAVKSAR
jgi:hypothetical protein